MSFKKATEGEEKRQKLFCDNKGFAPPNNRLNRSTFDRSGKEPLLLLFNFRIDGTFIKVGRFLSVQVINVGSSIIYHFCRAAQHNAIRLMREAGMCVRRDQESLHRRFIGLFTKYSARRRKRRRTTTRDENGSKMDVFTFTNRNYGSIKLSFIVFISN